ncbi:Conserved oligomeric Golgi complex subunit 2 [Podochytrium sp. JEL0797]|nr:Conserved oligomeric Golgi complex subunit 2 [Podochytrium sp. JEL0797]
MDEAEFSSDSECDSDDATALRIHAAGLSALRHEASLRLAQRKAELVDLINSDYAAFIGISTALKDYRPLPEGKDRIAALGGVLGTSRDELQAMASHIQALLAQRAQLRASKAALQTFISIEESVAKLEGLLGIADASSAAAPSDGKLVERVAIEYNQLLFLVTEAEKAGSEEVAVMKSLSGRIDRIKNALTSILRNTLESSLSAVSSSETIDMAAASSLTQCLRTYLLVDRVKDAGVELRAIVSPVIKTLATSFCQTLDKFYTEVLAYIETRLARILDISRHVFGASGGYDFLTDEILVVVWNCITEHFLGASNVGLPDAFHSNYLSTITFIESIEKSYFRDQPGALSHFRKHPSTVAVLKKWDLKIYFSLRKKELITSYDVAFEPNILKIRLLTESPEGLQLPQTDALLTTLRKIWTHNKIYLPALVADFWQFSLQCLNRYTAWLAEMAGSLGPALKELHEPTASAAPIVTPIANGSPSGTSTPATSAATPLPPIPVAAREDSILLVVAAVLEDIGLLNRFLLDLFNDSISERLPLGFPDMSVLKDQILESTNSLQQIVVSEIQSKSAIVLIKRCCIVLDQVRDVVQRTGFSSNLPTSASVYVSKILTPANEFFAKLALKAAEDGSLQKWKLSICEGVSTKYHAIVAQQLEDVAKLDRYSRSRKKTTVNEGAVSAYDKIKQQMTMDIGQFKVEIDALLGEGEHKVEGYQTLAGLVGL